MASRRPRRRGARVVRHEASASQGSTKILEESNEAIRQSRSDRHGSVGIISSSHEDDRKLGPTGSWSVQEQSFRECTSTFPKAGARNAPVQEMRSLQKFASFQNHFNHQRSIERRTRFKDLRISALLEWRELLAA